MNQDVPRSMTKVADFPHRRAGHCASGALRDLLELHRLDYGDGPLSEGAVFGLAGGLGFLYLELPELEPPIYLVGRSVELERDVADHLGIGLSVRQTEDAEEGWRLVREELDAGRPPMVWGDIGELEYLRVRMHNTRHDIVVAGFDADEQIVWIADNDRDQLQRCSLDSLARARNSGAFPGPNLSTTFLYEWPERLRDPAEATRAAIARAIDNMRDGRDASTYPSTGAGLDGVRGFTSAYADWPRAFGARLPAVLRGLRTFIVKAGTGGAMFRSLHAEFLHDMGELLGDRDLRALAGIYRGLASSWRSLAIAAELEDHASGQMAVRDICSMEHLGISMMEKWLARKRA